MEEDTAAIREAVEAIRLSLSRCEWCLYVLVHSLTIFVGIYLFRLALFAKDRFGKKILGLLVAVSLTNTANAQMCPEDGRYIPAGGAGFLEEAELLPNHPYQWTCDGTMSQVITGAAGDCNLLNGVQYRVIRVKFRGHNPADGASTTNDIDLVRLVFVRLNTAPANPAVSKSNHWRRRGSSDPWCVYIGGGGAMPDWDVCRCDPGCSDDCMYSAIAEYYDTPNGQHWPSTWSIVVHYGELGLTSCDEPEKDTDGDGDPDATDPDDDNDGNPDETDPDDDNDGIPDGMDLDQDSDGDGIPDPDDNDDDGDGIPDEKDGDEDDDGDGIPNPDDGDDDGDGVPDENDEDNDDDGDGIPNPTDPDDDGDGTPDENDPDHPNGPDDPPPGDTDGDGTPDETDPDDDGDGIPDEEDPDHPDFEDENPDSTGCEDWSFVSVFRLIGRQVLGLNNGLLEENASTWQDATGNGVQIPYVELEAFVSGSRAIKYMTLTSSGVVSWESGSYTIPGWITAASVVRIGLSAILVVWFTRVAVSMIGGLD